MDRKRGFCIAVVGAIPGAVLLRELLAAGRCAGKGGSYDYARAICDLTGGSYVSFAEMWGPRVWTAFLLCLPVAAAAVLLVYLPRLRAARHPLFRRIRILAGN